MNNRDTVNVTGDVIGGVTVNVTVNCIIEWPQSRFT